MSALKHDDKVGVKLVKVAGGIQELPFHLIVFRLEQVDVIATFHAHTPYGRSEELRGRIAYECHLECGKPGQVSLQQSLKFIKLVHSPVEHFPSRSTPSKTFIVMLEKFGT